MPRKLKLKTLLYSKHYREYTIGELTYVIDYRLSPTGYIGLPGECAADKAEKLKAKWNTKSMQQN